MEIKFRTLKADEIECRVATNNDKGVSLLIYKTARVDYAMLDEAVGATNWQVEYKEIKGNMYCAISIWDEDKKQWITKWNCGTEAKTEAEKSEASDAVKRSGFAWGIGRELYTAPFIWINLVDDEKSNGKIKPSVKFEVTQIEYDDQRNISKLVIKDNKGNERFTYGVGTKKAVEKPKQEPKPKAEQVAHTPNELDGIDTPKPQIKLLDKWELDIIASNPTLTAMMQDCLGGVKYSKTDIATKNAIATTMRAELKQRGLIL